jgi:cystathionine beta-lyase/cystathionine gamma-synthase
MGTTEGQLIDFQLALSNLTLESQGFDTLALHAGAFPDPTTGALLTPSYQTTTYTQEAVGKDKGFTYSRSANPTVSALERRLAALEGAEHCTCDGISSNYCTLSRSLRPVICRCFAGGLRWNGPALKQVLEPFGVTSDFVDTADETQLRQALAKKSRFVFIETPANPTLKLTIALATRIAHEAGALT